MSFFKKVLSDPVLSLNEVKVFETVVGGVITSTGLDKTKLAPYCPSKTEEQIKDEELAENIEKAFRAGFFGLNQAKSIAERLLSVYSPGSVEHQAIQDAVMLLDQRHQKLSRANCNS